MKALQLKKNDDGFTLIEVMIAVLILVIGLLATASLTTSLVKGNTNSFDKTTAINMVQTQMENIASTMTFDAGEDNEIIKADDDPNTSAGLIDPVTDNNDSNTDISANTALFTSPDCVVTATVDCSGAITVTLSSTPQLVYNIRDNYPIKGMKTVTVIVGWQKTLKNYFVTMQMMLTSQSISNKY